MRGEGPAGELAVEGVVVVQRRQRQRIHGHRRAVFLQREQLARVEDHMGVGGAAADPLHRRVIGVGIAVHAEQRLAGRLLRLEALGAHIAGLQIHMPVGEAEHGDMAFAIKRNVVGELRRVLEVRPHAIERPVDLAGNLALDFAVAQIDFATKRRGEAAEHWILAEGNRHYACPTSTRILVPSCRCRRSKPCSMRPLKGMVSTQPCLWIGAGRHFGDDRGEGVA